ncbi:MAG: hypothetical protein KL863_27730 [Rhizobium sp.]|nr:hypothetical protein [Rhizobium sp.]
MLLPFNEHPVWVPLVGIVPRNLYELEIVLPLDERQIDVVALKLATHDFPNFGISAATAEVAVNAAKRA